MKKFLIMIVFVITASSSFSQTWVQTLNGIAMWSLCKDTQGNVYAGTSGTVKAIYKTTNAGINWTAILPAGASNFLSLAVDSLGNIFAANVSNGMMKSTDGGNNWTNVPISTFNNKNVQTVACGKNGVVFVGCVSGGVFRSTDYGATFPDTGIAGGSIVTLMVDRYNPDKIYAGASSTSGTTGLFISTNGGLLFTGPYNTNTCWGLMQKSQTELYMVTTSTGAPFTKSTDGGFTWTTVSAQPGSMRGCALDLAGNIYISGNGGVFKSTNGGASFVNTGITASGNQMVSSGTRMYAAITGSTTGGVWILNDTTLTAVNPTANTIPENYELKQNYPNPFNPETTIEFSVPGSGYVNLSVYDVSGKQVKTLVSGVLNRGSYRVNFKGDELSSGVYIYSLKAGKAALQRKMLLIK